MFVTGPDVIKAVTHEEVSFEELGGASTHGAISGVAHFAAESEDECLALIRELMTFLPQNNLEDPPIRPTLRSRRPRRRGAPDGGARPAQQAVRHQGRRAARCSTTATSSRCRPTTPPTS